jgi:hypothetical protein
MVQHSFGLQLAEQSRPFSGRYNSTRIAERFEFEEFQAFPVGKLVEDLASAPYADHSPLAQRDLTTLKAFELRFLGPSPERLPGGFGWAESTHGPERKRYDLPRLAFADEYDRPGEPSLNDFLVRDKDKGEGMSQLLLELMAHKRSRLFGFRMANRFVNVLLPHAVLCRCDQKTHRVEPKRAWFVQPLVSFIRGGLDRGQLRQTYSLTFFLVPVEMDGELKCRATSASEVKQVVNADWGFAAARKTSEVAEYEVSGDLFRYLSSFAGKDWLAGAAANKGFPLRHVVELVAFGVGLGLAQGRGGEAHPLTAQQIGNDVIMALGSTRVSSIVMVDDSLEAGDLTQPVKEQPLPPPLHSLMSELAGSARPPLPRDEAALEHRLDRPFVDPDLYALGVLPAKRCLVTVGRGDGQYGARESALMQAGSTAYMTIGAATAVGSMRAIDRRLERLEGADPRKIGEIDREIASDLAEIHDLDITRESYREIYRHLRERLGIARDYEILQNKMDALYRATSTFHERKAELQLAWLTAAIVILSVFILIGTLILVGKEG